MDARRRKLWEVGGNLQCSIVGTCLSHDDLLAIARSSGVSLVPGAAAYDVHAHFVQQAGTASPLARAMQKLLEGRYARVVRKVSATSGEADLTSLWQDLNASGNIAGAYWAFLSHGHVPQSVSTRVFGDVHMLSHVLGRVTHADAAAVSSLKARVEDLEARLLRGAERSHGMAADRDRWRDRCTALERGSATQSMILPAATRYPGIRDPVVQGNDERRQRALLSARQRARRAESEVLELRDEVARLRLLIVDQHATQACPAAEKCNEVVRSDRVKRVLYLGGRSGAIDRLRAIASSVNSEFLHHDGGEEQALSRIDGLVAGCDAVFCPIDCVSHSACLRAKALCRKLSVPFVPLRSSGTTSFQRALDALA